MEKDDTRRIAAFGSYYRVSAGARDKKVLTDSDDMCLLTEVRDGSYAYEGFNLITECKTAEKWSKIPKDKRNSTYGGPKVSNFS